MVGEIRDLETADIAIKAAQTGHMVLSTLHTNDAPTTLTRLMNMGVAPVQHRLVGDPDHRAAPGAPAVHLQAAARHRRGRAARRPDSSRATSTAAGSRSSRSAARAAAAAGYKGRVGIYQVMPITEEIQRIILTNGNAMQIAEQAQARGRQRPAPLRAAQGHAGPDHDRGSARRHQRVAPPERTATRGERAWQPRRRQPRRSRKSTFVWEGRDRAGKTVRGEMRAGGEAVVNATLRRQGILVTKIKKRRYATGGKITRQGHHAVHAPARDDDEGRRAAAAGLRHRRQGQQPTPRWPSCSPTSRPTSRPAPRSPQAFRKYPLYFDSLFCNLVGAGEQAGILDDLLDRLATYKEKILAIKGKIKSALFYPVAIIVVAVVVTAVIMMFVIPAFKEVFESFGAGPARADADGHRDVGLLRRLLVPDLRRASAAPCYFFMQAWKRSPKVQMAMDRLMLRAADLRRGDPQGDHRALAAHALDDVRRRRAAGRGARLGGRRLGQLRLLRPPRRSSRRSPPAPA